MTSPRCKICGAGTDLQGYVDAGRSCEIRNRVYLPLTGQPIAYWRCTACGFLFTGHFDHWTFEDFRTEIYNDDYPLADPGWTDGIRAREGGRITAILMGQYQAKSLLDYGGGKGAMAAALRAGGTTAFSYDPLFDDSPPVGPFDLVTAFEVFEHTPTPVATAREALSFVAPDGRLVLTTLLIDGLPPQCTDHWYIAPRNGHVSIHTKASLTALFAPLGWSVRSIGPNTHMAERVG